MKYMDHWSIVCVKFRNLWLWQCTAAKKDNARERFFPDQFGGMNYLTIANCNSIVPKLESFLSLISHAQMMILECNVGVFFSCFFWCMHYLFSIKNSLAIHFEIIGVEFIISQLFSGQKCQKRHQQQHPWIWAANPRECYWFQIHITELHSPLKK